MLYKLSFPLSVAVLVLAGGLSSCQRVEPVNQIPEPGEHVALDQLASELTFRLVAEGNQSPIEPGEYVYRDADAWRAVQEGIRRPAYEPSLAMEAVLLAAVDAPTGGYRVRFDSVRVIAGEVEAIYTIEEPGADCMVTQALTQPFQAVAVTELAEGAVRFVQRRQTYDC